MDDDTPAVGHYRSADGRSYRVLALRDHPAMRLIERRDQHGWRHVGALPADAAREDDGPLPPALDEIPPPAEAMSLRAWLQVLEDMRATTRAALAALLHEYDATRAFSASAWDRDYDADLLHGARAAPPLLLALEDAIDTVRACCERDRGTDA